MKRFQVQCEDPNIWVTWNYHVAYESERRQKALKKAANLRSHSSKLIVVFNTVDRTYNLGGATWLPAMKFLQIRREARALCIQKETS